MVHEYEPLEEPSDEKMVDIKLYNAHYGEYMNKRVSEREAHEIWRDKFYAKDQESKIDFEA